MTQKLDAEIQALKRIKIIQDEGEEDRLSGLLEGLLLDILSRLDSTKEVIRTCVLSKRWEHVWTKVPTLVFTCDSFPRDDLFIKFFNNVDKVITKCSFMKLKKFQLKTFYDIQFESHVNRWICRAVKCNVEEFDLELRGQRLQYLDQAFFNSCFIHLNLEGCILNPTAAISWRKLKSLCINNATLDDYLMHNIISGSPLLETLELFFCYGFRLIDITSKSVKSLVFHGFINLEQDPDNTRHVVEINAPYIMSLKIEDSLNLSNLVLLNVSSLVKVELNYKASLGVLEEADILRRLIRTLGHVNELNIGEFCLKALYELKDQGFELPSNIKYHDITSPLCWFR